MQADEYFFMHCPGKALSYPAGSVSKYPTQNSDGAGITEMRQAFVARCLANGLPSKALPRSPAPARQSRHERAGSTALLRTCGCRQATSKPHPLNFRTRPEVQTLLAAIMQALAPFPKVRAVLAQAMANLHEPKVIDHKPVG